MKVLFRAAGGPRRGFGHLVRSTWLARELGVPPVVSIRGGRQARHVARALGHRLTPGPAATVLAREAPDLLVIDDPSGAAADRWCRAARRRRTPVASLHDLGLARCASDLPIDGSVVPGEYGRRGLSGPKYAVLNPRLRPLRARVSPGGPTKPRPRVLITLGGGARAEAAWRLGRRLAVLRPEIDVHVAGGFLGKPRRSPRPNLRWLPPANGLAGELARATVALVAGGVTVYEACCLGVPAVAVAVVPAQRPTVRAFAARGAVIDGGTTRDVGRAMKAVLTLIDDGQARRAQGRRARALVDGRGAARVAAALKQLVTVDRRP